jgi:hypothetical protein
MQILISMQRSAWINTPRSALEQAERPGDDDYLFNFAAIDNDSGRRVEVRFDNEDLERDEVAATAGYVEANAE